MSSQVGFVHVFLAVIFAVLHVFMLLSVPLFTEMSELTKLGLVKGL